MTCCFSAGDFHEAMSQLQADASALQTATNYAEVCLSSEDGVKNLLAANMKKQLEMMRRMSVPRKRWATAINRILVQNYVAKIRERVEGLYPTDAVKSRPLGLVHSRVKAKPRTRHSYSEGVMKLHGGSSLPPLEAVSFHVAVAQDAVMDSSPVNRQLNRRRNSLGGGTHHQKLVPMATPADPPTLRQSFSNHNSSSNLEVHAKASIPVGQGAHIARKSNENLGHIILAALR